MSDESSQREPEELAAAADRAEAEQQDRRQHLKGLGKWSGAAMVAAAAGGWLGSSSDAQAASWINRRGGRRSGSWINRSGGAGWINRPGGGWINRPGGWINRRVGPGSWINRW